MAIGFSNIGRDIRQLWFEHRDCLKKEDNLKSFLRKGIGDRIENDILDNLSFIFDGFQDRIIVDERTGRQPKLVIEAGILEGFADGFVKLNGEWFLLEVKSTESKHYRAIIKHGIQKHKPVWYHQVNAMLWANKKVNSAKLVIVNRDACEHTVIDVERDEVLDAYFYLNRALVVINSEAPPEAEGFIVDTPFNIEIITGIRPPSPACKNCSIYDIETKSCSKRNTANKLCCDYSFLPFFKEKVLHSQVVNDVQLASFTYDEINSGSFSAFNDAAKFFEARNPTF